MSSQSRCRCSEEHAGQEWESLKAHIHPNHRDRRKCRPHSRFTSLFKKAAPVIALVLAALCAIIIQTYTPVSPQSSSPNKSPHQRTDLAWTKHLLDILAELGGIRRWAEDNLDAILRRVPRSETLERATAHIGAYVSELGILELISDPPPPLFFAACLGFAWAISFFRHSHSVDRYQDTILSGGVAAGILVAAVQSNGFLMDVKGYLTWSIVLASVASALSHRVLGFFPGPTTRESRIEKPGQSSDLRPEQSQLTG